MKLLNFAVLSIAVALGGLSVYSKLELKNFKRTSFAGLNAIEDTPGAVGTRYTYISPEGATESMTVKIQVRASAEGALPGKPGSPPVHIHNLQEECFVIKAGHAGYLMNGVEGSLTPKDTADAPLCVPVGASHTIWSKDPDTDLEADVTLTPALNTDVFFRNLAALGHDYGSLGKVNPLQLLSTFVAGGVTLVDVPSVVWSAIKVAIPHVAPVFGFQPFYAEYAKL